MPLGLGRSGGVLDHLVVPFRLRLRPETLPLRVSFDDEVLRAYVQTIAAEVDRAPVNAALTLQDNRVVSVAPATGQQLEIAEDDAAYQELLALSNGSSAY